MNNKVIELPIIIGGEVYYPSNERENIEIEYANGVKVIIPKANKSDIEKIKNINKYMLHDMHFQEIINFLRKVGKFWDLSNASDPLYVEAMNNLSAINGYDLKMSQRELNIINVMCSFGDTLHDMLDAELGSKFYLEEWLPVADALVHAEPKGNVLNIMVGNVPISSVMSLVRSIITKNKTIAKLPKRDPITALYFALSFLKIDPNNPVSKSISIIYWQREDETEKSLIDISDVVVIWGGGAAVESIRSKTKSGTDIIEFGPKTSFAVIDKDASKSSKVAIDLAHDISIYNQEACFSTQMAFVEGNSDILINNLKHGLEKYSKLLPKGEATFDVHAHVTRTRLEELYKCNIVVQSRENTDWTIIKINDPSEIKEHPLSRVIYVIELEKFEDFMKYVNENTQTITISPWSRNTEIRDRATLLGASKITEIGLAEWQRIGMPHDNVYPLSRLVRWVGVERGLDYLGKNIEDGPVDTTLWLMMNENLLENIGEGKYIQ